MVKVTMIFLFTVFGLTTSNAQVLLSTTEDPTQRIRSYQNKLDYLKFTKVEIELKQGRTRQDTVPADGRNPLTGPKGNNTKLKKKEVPKKKAKKAKTPE